MLMNGNLVSRFWAIRTFVPISNGVGYFSWDPEEAGPLTSVSRSVSRSSSYRLVAPPVIGQSLFQLHELVSRG